MKERYKDRDIIVQINEKDNLEQKNDTRKKTIKEHFMQNYSLPKEKARQFISDDKTESVKNIDFTRANPRNNSFMNEIAFMGESVTEGFLDVFNIEVDKAVDKYMEKNHIIEQRKDNGETKAFTGVFKKNRLKRTSEYFKDQRELENHIDGKVANREKEQKLNQEKKQEQSLSLKRDYED